MANISNDGAGPVLRIAVPSPLRRHFDYLPAADTDLPALAPGIRIKVPFAGRRLVGILVEVVARSSINPDRLKPIIQVLDKQPLITEELMALLKWASDYYQYSLGMVLSNAIPVLLRQGKPASLKGQECWCLTESGHAIELDQLSRAPRQAALLKYLAAHHESVTAKQIEAELSNWRPIMTKLVAKGWVRVSAQTSINEVPDKQTSWQKTTNAPQLNQAQQQAIDLICQNINEYHSYLLDGVTGSGKTEVYLHAVDAVLAVGKQALVLVPEIGLTPQLVSRFKQRFAKRIVVFHSGLSDQERLQAWLLAYLGLADVIIGTRSAVFTPLLRPGVIVVDEEHDMSFKQQDGFRYSARDIAVMRAQRLSIPIVLGSATPSLETLSNVSLGRYQPLLLPQRAGIGKMPQIRIMDMRDQPMEDGLSQVMLESVASHLARGNQVLLFLNRRGFAPALFCHACGWIAECRRCDSRLTLYQTNRRLRCHHCGSNQQANDQCPACNSQALLPIGEGTQRIEAALKLRFPEIATIRIDGDTTQRKNDLNDHLAKINSGLPCILIGTQILAKGHHFPKVTFVGVISVDQGLFSADFRSTEHMAQLIIQVAGRAGREEDPGQVMIQTHFPDHPLLKQLVEFGYSKFANSLLAERQLAQLPPYRYMALLRAEAVDENLPLRFLNDARDIISHYPDTSVAVQGPVPAPMERRAGRYRAQLLLQATQRRALHQLLTPWLQELGSSKLGRKVRWSIDVDPMEMF
jgi:primosomal protein N' (replication factor Y)